MSRLWCHVGRSQRVEHRQAAASAPQLHCRCREQTAHFPCTGFKVAMQQLICLQPLMAAWCVPAGGHLKPTATNRPSCCTSTLVTPSPLPLSLPFWPAVEDMQVSTSPYAAARAAAAAPAAAAGRDLARAARALEQYEVGQGAGSLGIVLVGVGRRANSGCSTEHHPAAASRHASRRCSRQWLHVVACVRQFSTSHSSRLESCAGARRPCRTRGSRCLGLGPATCRSSSASSQRRGTLRR